MEIRASNHHKPLAALTLGLILALPAQAALHDRGGGLLYDDVLNITWLQDANYAKSSGYDADGSMHWYAAKTWAANLVYHDNVRNITYDDWRLANNNPVGAAWDYYYSFNGSTDVSFNATSPRSELSYMYYVNLGLKGYYSSSGVYQPDFGVHGNGTTGGQKDVGPVKNLNSYVYWSGTAYAPYSSSYAWVFDTYNGLQEEKYNYSEFLAWAVRPGDVAAAVPEPETYALMLAGLGLLGVVAKQRLWTFADL